MKRIEIAPAGRLEGRPAHQEIADQRSRSNAACFKRAGMRLSGTSDAGKFLRQIALHPERVDDAEILHGIPEPIYGLPDYARLADHPRLYTRDGAPFAIIFHPYARLNLARMQMLVKWCTEIGVALQVDADSEYYPGVALRVILYREGLDFPKTDLA